ncbi:MAG TPA: hypothetical protein VMU59_12285 [Caulobacteraceae bacterium]|nr:hypothetical protein [Caulobacteraceae bacterium]
MLNKAMIAAAAALAIGGSSIAATAADAAPRGIGGAGFHGEGFRGGDRDGWRGGGWAWGWRRPGVYVGPAWGYGDCGWRWSPYYGRYVRACW